MDENMRLEDLYSSLIGKPVTKSELADILAALQSSETETVALLGALGSLKNAGAVSRMQDAARMRTEEVHGATLRCSSDDFVAGFISGTVHGAIATTGAMSTFDREVQRVGAAMVSLLVFAIGRTLKERDIEWPEELNETIQ